MSEPPSGYYPNYGYVGAPTNYNGTGANGGDSGMRKPPITLLPPFSLLPLLKIEKTKIDFSIHHSRRKPESMVRSGRPGIYPRLIMYGPSHDSRPGLPLLRTRAPKVCPVHDLGLHGLILSHRFPMVLLGLLAGIQLVRHKRIYWEPGAFWSDEHPCNAIPRITTHF